MVNVGAPLIDIVAGGMCNVAAPDLNEFSTLHVVLTGLYAAKAGLITLN